MITLILKGPHAFDLSKHCQDGSIKFMKFIAPDPIFSLFSPLDTGVFVVIATALHSWGPWVVN